MAQLFGDNMIFIYFFAIIAIFNYSNLSEEQKITIVYITVYALAFLKLASIKMSIFLICIALFCNLEFFTKDKIKLRLLTNPVYKIIDCIFMSFSQYYVHFIFLAILLNAERLKLYFPSISIYFSISSAIILIWGINCMLSQAFVINTFDKMMKPFEKYPLQNISFKEIPAHYYSILTSIEDRTYYKRKSTTYLSFNMLKLVLSARISKNGSLITKMKVTAATGWRFAYNTIKRKRGYSTIQMQLMRSIGIESGYECTFRRKIFELIYTPIFFRSLMKFYKKKRVTKRGYFKDYLIYIYFRTVNTFFDDIYFTKFYKAFDFTGEKKTDLKDWSLEGVFIACMGLSKRASMMNEDNIDYYLGTIEGVKLDKERILEMVKNFRQRMYDGEYLA